MNKRLIMLLPLAVFVVLALFLGKGLFLNPREVPSPFIGRPAPQFALAEVGNPARSFSPKEMLGKVWMLNVWAPWCVSCRQEHGVLMQLKDQGVVIVGLNWKDKDREAAELMARMGTPYVINLEDLDGRVGIDYGVTGTPETFLIDKQGIIRYKQTGPINAEVWTEKLEPRMKEMAK
ncbi:MAG: DsbE family thiol:disulfide interchange protein [Betaproteobacteria bacterium]|jgi:cytochrome c biogenesis protein CcmG, thiol:disulfide interchange protein DsbE|nr:MAG: DsbE family thiol:disulfide interchange protein [Betaproteobacteria bacterium]